MGGWAGWRGGASASGGATAAPLAGYEGIKQDECEQRGCCWDTSEFKHAPHVDLPWCFLANTGDSSYAVAGGAAADALKSVKGARATPGLALQRRHAHPLSRTLCVWAHHRPRRPTPPCTHRHWAPAGC